MPDQTNQVPLSEIADGGLFLVNRTLMKVLDRRSLGVRVFRMGSDKCAWYYMSLDTLVTPLKLVPADAELCPKGTLEALRTMTDWAACLDLEMLSNSEAQKSAADTSHAMSILTQAEAMQ